MTPLSTPAAGTVAVRETAIAICERWLAAFADIEIEYTSARQYASGAVRDIIDQIREIDVSASPSPEALPAGGVEDRLAKALDFLAENKSRSLAFDGKTFCEDDNSDLWIVTEVQGSLNDREWVLLGSGRTPAEALLDAAALTSTPAPEDRS